MTMTHQGGVKEFKLEEGEVPAVLRSTLKYGDVVRVTDREAWAINQVNGERQFLAGFWMTVWAQEADGTTQVRLEDKAIGLKVTARLKPWQYEEAYHSRVPGVPSEADWSKPTPLTYDHQNRRGLLELLIPVILVILLFGLWTFISKAQAKDCYVQRFSYSTSVRCDDGDEALIMEDNTRGRHRGELPSQRRLPSVIYEDKNGTTRCSQTGSIYSCR